MKNLANLKADCVLARGMADEYPSSLMAEIAYEKAQYAVEAKERELFCDIKEKP